jgi:hypothetical protein
LRRADARRNFAYRYPLGDIILGAVTTAARRPGGLHKTSFILLQIEEL